MNMQLFLANPNNDNWVLHAKEEILEEDKQETQIDADGNIHYITVRPNQKGLLLY